MQEYSELVSIQLTFFHHVDHVGGFGVSQYVGSGSYHRKIELVQWHFLLRPTSGCPRKIPICTFLKEHISWIDTWIYMELLDRPRSFKRFERTINFSYFQFTIIHPWANIPGHLRTLMWGGKDGSWGPTLTNSRRTHQNQGDSLCNHRPWSENAQKNEDGREDVSQSQLKCYIEGICHWCGCVDTEVVWSSLHSGSDGKLWCCW